MRVTLYHSTRPERAELIVRDGFVAGDQFVSDTPLPRRYGDLVLVLEWNGTPEELATYEYNKHQWRPHGNDYREWRISGERLNQCPRPSVLPSRRV